MRNEQCNQLEFLIAITLETSDLQLVRAQQPVPYNAQNLQDIMLNSFSPKLGNELNLMEAARQSLERYFSSSDFQKVFSFNILKQKSGDFDCTFFPPRFLL